MRISDWSSDVCSSDLKWFWRGMRMLALVGTMMDYMLSKRVMSWKEAWEIYGVENGGALFRDLARYGIRPPKGWDLASEVSEHELDWLRSEEHTSELQSLMRISYAVFCLKKKK